MIRARFVSLDPADWPQEERIGRAYPRFRSTWEQTLDLLDRELEHLGARQVTIEAAFDPGQIRNDGWPRSDARDPVFPGIILSFDSKHGSLRYLTDTYTGGSYYERGKWRPLPGWQANVRAIALSLEALRAVDRYGVSKRGEQYRGWDALPPGTPMPAAKMTVEEAARLLWTEGGATGSFDVERACQHVASLFRHAVRGAHPDKGGDPEMFRRLTEARDLLASTVVFD